MKVKTIESDKKLAACICTLLTKIRIDIDEKCLPAVIAHADNIEDRVLVVSQTIEHNPQNIALTENLLQALPEPYCDIASHDRKHPTFENTPQNLRLLDALTGAGYLSSYSHSDKGLKVNKKILG